MKDSQLQILDSQNREKEIEIRNLTGILMKSPKAEISNFPTSPVTNQQLHILTERLEKSERDFQIKAKESLQKEDEMNRLKDKIKKLKKERDDKQLFCTTLEKERKELEFKNRGQERDWEYREKKLSDQLEEMTKKQATSQQRSGTFLFIIIFLFVALLVGGSYCYLPKSD